jgi:hypothetical protein
MDLDAIVALPVLSVRQPWASFIISGLKSIELRSWSTEYRGWLWIHAGKRPDTGALGIFGLAARDFRTGGLVGIAYLESCELIRTAAQWDSMRNDHRSPGAFVSGVYAWRFVDVLALSDTIVCRGELGLFRFDETTRQRIRQQLHDAPGHQEFLDAVLNA